MHLNEKKMLISKAKTYTKYWIYGIYYRFCISHSTALLDRCIGSTRKSRLSGMKLPHLRHAASRGRRAACERRQATPRPHAPSSLLQTAVLFFIVLIAHWNYLFLLCLLVCLSRNYAPEEKTWHLSEAQHLVQCWTHSLLEWINEAKICPKANLPMMHCLYDCHHLKSSSNAEFHDSLKGFSLEPKDNDVP